MQFNKDQTRLLGDSRPSQGFSQELGLSNAASFMYFAAVGPVLMVASLFISLNNSTSQLLSAKLAARLGAESWHTHSLRAGEENVNETDVVMHPNPDCSRGTCQVP